MHFDVIRQGNNIGAMGAVRSLVWQAARAATYWSTKFKNYVKIHQNYYRCKHGVCFKSKQSRS